MKYITKKIGILFYLFLNFVNTNAQQVTYYKQFSGSSETSFFSVDTVHDGGNILVGQEFSHDGGNYLILKTDSLGNELWRKSANYFSSTDSSNYLASVIETKNHDFLMCGEMRFINNTPNKQILIIRTDSIGNIIWLKIEANSSASYGKKIIELENSDFVILGLIEGSTNSDILVKKYNSSGDSIWSRLISNAPKTTLPSAIFNNKANLFIAGAIYDSLALHTWTSVAKMDTSGNILANNQIPDSFRIRPLNIYSDGTPFINLPCIKLLQAGGAVTCIIRLDSMLNEINRFAFPTISACTFINDTNFVGAIEGMTFYKGSILDDTIWTNFINEEFGSPSQIVFDHSGCAIICGRIDDGQSTSSIGIVIKICDSLSTSIVSDNSTKAKPLIFPNPSNYTIVVNIDQALLGNGGAYDMLLYDSKGKLATSFKKITSNISHLNVEELKRGMYSYLLKNKTNVFTGKIIIIL